MEGHCSTGQSPQWAVVPMAEEEEDTYCYPCALQNKRFYFLPLVV